MLRTDLVSVSGVSSGFLHQPLHHLKAPAGARPEKRSGPLFSTTTTTREIQSTARVLSKIKKAIDRSSAKNFSTEKKKKAGTDRCCESRASCARHVASSCSFSLRKPRRSSLEGKHLLIPRASVDNPLAESGQRACRKCGSRRTLGKTLEFSPGKKHAFKNQDISKTQDFGTQNQKTARDERLSIIPTLPTSGPAQKTTPASIVAAASKTTQGNTPEAGGGQARQTT